MEHLFNQQQFGPPGDDSAKAALNKQLKGNFPKEARAWLKDDRVRVEGPVDIDATELDWGDYPEWRASRQLDDVQKKAAKIKDGKRKPIVTVQRPNAGDKLIIDGHHKAMGYVDAKQQPRGFIVHVPSQNGPWDDFHAQQRDDKKKDDFGKTHRKDRLG